MSGDGGRAHRHAVTGWRPEGGPQTLIVWREADARSGRVVYRVAITLDSTWACLTMLTPAQAVALADALHDAAGSGAAQR